MNYRAKIAISAGILVVAASSALTLGARNSDISDDHAPNQEMASSTARAIETSAPRGSLSKAEMVNNPTPHPAPAASTTIETEATNLPLVGVDKVKKIADLKKISASLSAAMASSSADQRIEVLIGLVEPYLYDIPLEKKGMPVSGAMHEHLLPRAEREGMLSKDLEPLIDFIESHGGVITMRPNLTWVLGANVPTPLILQIAAFDYVTQLQIVHMEVDDDTMMKS